MTTINKNYQIQPTPSQWIAIKLDHNLNVAIRAAQKNNNESIDLCIKSGFKSVEITIKSDTIFAYAEIGTRGKVHCSYSNVK